MNCFLFAISKDTTKIISPTSLYPLPCLHSGCITTSSSPNCVFLSQQSLPHHQIQHPRGIIFPVYEKSYHSVLSSLLWAPGTSFFLGFILSKYNLTTCHVSRTLLMTLHTSLFKHDSLLMPMLRLPFRRGKDTWRSLQRSMVAILSLWERRVSPDLIQETTIFKIQRFLYFNKSCNNTKRSMKAGNKILANCFCVCKVAGKFFLR